jgi:histidyl-tRNA synthetase
VRYPSDWLDWLEHEFTILDDGGRLAFQNLREILRLAAATNVGPRLRFEPSLARGLSYYTGAIMEVSVPDLSGSLGGGGRYDGLIGMFSGEDIPACGFSLGLERILVVMTERNMFPADVHKPSADVIVTLFEGQPIEDGLRLAADLRGAGLRVEVYPAPEKLGKQLKYAGAKGIPFAAILGGDEIATGQVTVKNLTTGEQRRVARADVIRVLTETL